ncbi:hypothetical protein P154DRAFT_575740 [Amniculicola lignicola CBS 123094]|uniref:Uncharacterized protein n=1 Tax=Amniculicola lignicola CBS 123094 TaxID=1392246 RepID=A0A6A5WNP0_9PLEO|nr:hypothetical protein P154DRAFT_575740 [Amniculicola lignicola CBS 123094]
MCHWALHIWKCGESYFTKSSPCSFDRAVHDPDSLLNPLHPSVVPTGLDNKPLSPPSTQASTPNAKKPGKRSHQKKGRKSNNNNNRSGTPLPRLSLSRTPLPTIKDSSNTTSPSAQDQFAPDIIYATNTDTGARIPIPLCEVGKASSLGDRNAARGENAKCHIFEVVVQKQEPTIHEPSILVSSAQVVHHVSTVDLRPIAPAKIDSASGDSDEINAHQSFIVAWDWSLVLPAELRDQRFSFDVGWSQVTKISRHPLLFLTVSLLFHTGFLDRQ